MIKPMALQAANVAQLYKAGVESNMDDRLFDKAELLVPLPSPLPPPRNEMLATPFLRRWCNVEDDFDMVVGTAGSFCCSSSNSDTC